MRWAAKEAAYKALSPAFRPVWHELTYMHDASGRPMLRYERRIHLYTPEDRVGRGNRSEAGDMKEGPDADKRDGTPRLKALHTSMSHDGEYVIANVLAEVYDV